MRPWGCGRSNGLYKAILFPHLLPQHFLGLFQLIIRMLLASIIGFTIEFTDDIRLYAKAVDIVAVWRVIGADGDLHRRTVTERDNLLHDALAKCGSPH